MFAIGSELRRSLADYRLFITAALIAITAAAAMAPGLSANPLPEIKIVSDVSGSKIQVDGSDFLLWNSNKLWAVTE